MDVSRAVARRLGEWHARVPIVADKVDITPKKDEHEIEDRLSRSIPIRTLSKQEIKAINAITPGKPIPNLWTVMQKWIHALPTVTEAEGKRKIVLQKELERTVAELGDTLGLGNDGVCIFHQPITPLHRAAALTQLPLTSFSLSSATATS